MHHRTFSSAALAFGLLTATAGSAWAQAIPNTARPDVVEKQNRIETIRPDVGGAPLIKVQQDEAKSINGGVAFVLKGIKLQGATAFGEAELEPLYKDKIGTKITLGDLNGIANSITSYYRNHGYILTRAIIPPQRAEGGVITIRIVEGYASNVIIEGEMADDPLVQKYAAKIRATRPLDSSKLERYLLLMNDLPGVEARAVLKPSATEPGASDIVVTLSRKSTEFLGTFDNRGSRYLGPFQLGANLYLNNLLGADEQTQFRVANSIFQPEEMVYAEARHEEQLGSEGTKLLLAASGTWTHPGYTLEDLDTTGESGSITLGVSHPLTRSRQSNWFVNSDFTGRNVSVDNFAGDVYYDKTRVLTLGTSYDFLDSTSAINRIEGGFGKGFGWGTDVDGQPQSRIGGKANFEKLTARASRIQPISGPWAAYFATAGQYGFDPLLASEEFGLGGAEFGSAYDAAELSGDSGIAGRVEMQFNQFRDQADFLPQYQVYAFYDIGKVWNRDVIAASEPENASLSSTGIGARFSLLDSLNGGIEAALPLTRKVAAYGEDGSSPRVFFNLQYQY